MGKPGRKPKIVLLDIESLPDLERVMEVFPSLGDYPGLTLKASINSILCFGWKVHGSRKRAHVKGSWEHPGFRKSVNDDKEVCKFIRNLLLDADAIVTHNGARFDLKFINTRLVINGLPPLPPILHVDTCKLAKKDFLFFNNRLNTLSKSLGHKGKIDNGGWGLWVKCRHRDAKALKMMARYCARDVEALEEIFDSIKGHASVVQLPNHNLFHPEHSRCPKCGSLALVKEGTRTYKLKIVSRFSCKSCGSWSQQGEKERFPR